MLYLLTANWEWFAVALFIGLAVGWLTTTREQQKFSGHGAVVTAAFALAGGFLLANLQTVPGHAGLYLELALLITSAYGLGLPVGGGVKLLILGRPAAAPAKKKPPIVVVRGAPQEERAAVSSAPVEAPPVPPPVPVSRPEPPHASAAPAPATAPAAPPDGAKKIPGQRPDELAGPRGGKPDDLSKIKGVGPKSVEKLHAIGVYHFDQIAAWTPDNIKWISASLSIPGRIEKGRWVAQAKELASAGQSVTERDDVSTPAQ